VTGVVSPTLVDGSSTSLLGLVNVRQLHSEEEYISKGHKITYFRVLFLKIVYFGFWKTTTKNKTKQNQTGGTDIKSYFVETALSAAGMIAQPFTTPN
jgi:hypothetical protein